MGAEGYQLISIIGFVCAGAFGIATVAMFFAFHIPAVIDELSGKNAMRQVEELRARNKKAVNKRAIISNDIPMASTVKVIDDDSTEVLNNTVDEDATIVLSPEEANIYGDKLTVLNQSIEIHSNTTID